MCHNGICLDTEVVDPDVPNFSPCVGGYGAGVCFNGKCKFPEELPEVTSCVNALNYNPCTPNVPCRRTGYCLNKQCTAGDIALSGSACTSESIFDGVCSAGYCIASTTKQKTQAPKATQPVTIAPSAGPVESSDDEASTTVIATGVILVLLVSGIVVYLVGWGRKRKAASYDMTVSPEKRDASVAINYSGTVAGSPGRGSITTTSM